MSSRLDVPSRLRSPLPTPASLPFPSSTTGSLKKDKMHGQRRAPSNSAPGRIRAADASPEQEHHEQNFLRAKASSGRCYTTLDAAHSGMDDGAIVVGVDASAANFPGAITPCTWTARGSNWTVSSLARHKFCKMSTALWRLSDSPEALDTAGPDG